VSRLTQTVVCDFEYEVADGDLPNVLCMVAYVLDENRQHVRTIRLWRGEFGSAPPFDTGPDTLFVAYSAWAELTCFMTLGWRFPEHVFDLHAAYLSATNILLPYDPDEKRKRQNKKLPDACRSYGVEGWENIDKGTMAKDIGEGRWQIYGVERVFEYCEEDVRASMHLFKRMLEGRSLLPASNLDLVLHWSNYSAKAVAQIQACGMPIDMVLWNKVQENKAIVIRHLLERLDPSRNNGDPIYTSDGRFEYARFERWLAGQGVLAWPRTESGMLQTDGDAYRMMYHVPGIEALHALKDSLRVIVGAKLPIGRDGRNRPKLFPFCTKTGRNAHTSSLFNAHAGMRSFMKFDSGVTAVYLDWRTQEVGIAAALSGDEALKEAYVGGDVYHALALTVGATNDPDPQRWKQTNPAMRQRMKSLQLAILYGMSVPSLARGLDRHPCIAVEILERHKRTYPEFWAWRDAAVMSAMLDREIKSVFGWSLRISHSPNRRALFNFPMQANGAEMLRLAAVRMCEAGLVPNMLVHDGLLLEARSAWQIEQAKEIMHAAGREVCSGFEVGVDIDQELKHGARFRDKRPLAKKMWGAMMRALHEVGAIEREELLRELAAIGELP
jgi:DNA polymerase I